MEHLKAFRNLVTEKMCQFWENPPDLGSKVSRSLIKLIKQHPGIGWVRADELPSEEVNQEILALRKKVDVLESELAQVQTQAPKGAENLAQGDDIFEIQFTFSRHRGEFDFSGTTMTDKIHFTWNDIFYQISPLMIDEASDARIKGGLSSAIFDNVERKLKDHSKDEQLGGFEIRSDSFHTIIVQLRALGLITKSVKNRSVKDKNTYWRLTPYGENVMTHLRAIRR